MQETLFPNLSHLLLDGSLNPESIRVFQGVIKDYYRNNRRSFEWRETFTPYNIVVSEIMLQQTQTDRVKEKYHNFVKAFASFEALANAPFHQVLLYWQGLGYNRRALSLHKTAQIVCERFNGVLPSNPEILVELPGIGKATAASICAFAFNYPSVFIETNIRTVYIHTFFRDQSMVKDNDLLPLIESTLDAAGSREWYYALMDYGVALKKTFKNPSRKSAHHIQQSKFEGSERQIRGMILRALTTLTRLSFDELCNVIPRERVRIERNLQNLCDEGFIDHNKNLYSIKNQTKWL